MKLSVVRLAIRLWHVLTVCPVPHLAGPVVALSRLELHFLSVWAALYTRVGLDQVASIQVCVRNAPAALWPLVRMCSEAFGTWWGLNVLCHAANVSFSPTLAPPFSMLRR